MPLASKTTVLLAAVLALGLAGCDRAEQAAQSVTREAGRIAAEEGRKALQSTGEALNRGIDSAQEASRRWLDGAERAAQDRAENRERDSRNPEQSPGNARDRGDKGLSI